MMRSLFSGVSGHYLERIGNLGFGKNASTGKGRFAVEHDAAFDPVSLASSGTKRLLLSPCAAGDMRSLDGCYAVEVKRGKAALHIAGGNPFKNPILCVREGAVLSSLPNGPYVLRSRSEERRVGKECRSRWSPYH